MSTTFSTDPDAFTVASASYGDDPDARAKTGALKLFTASCLIAGVAALGAVLFAAPDQVDVVIPGATGTGLVPAGPTGPSPSPIVVAPPVGQAPTAPTPMGPRDEAPKPKPFVAPAPVPVPAEPMPPAPEPSVPSIDDVIVLPPLPEANPKPPIIKTPPPNVLPPIIKTPPPNVVPPIIKAPPAPVPPKPAFPGPIVLTDQ